MISILVLLENLHAVGHFKDEFPTCLNFAHNLGNSVYESIKRITNWAAYYFTHPTSYYPVSETTIALKEISRLPHLGKTRRLNSNEQQMRREWAVQHGEVFVSALSNKRDSENEHSVEEDDEDDSLTFMRKVTLRRGRAVRVKFFFHRFVHSVLQNGTNVTFLTFYKTSCFKRDRENVNIGFVNREMQNCCS